MVWSRLFLGEPAAGTGTAVLVVEGSWPMLEATSISYRVSLPPVVAVNGLPNSQ